jgi:hypothetical protein
MTNPNGWNVPAANIGKRQRIRKWRPAVRPGCRGWSEMGEKWYAIILQPEPDRVIAVWYAQSTPDEAHKKARAMAAETNMPVALAEVIEFDVKPDE